MQFELSNSDRKYLGLDSANEDWKIIFINNDLVYYIDENSFIRKISYIFEYDDFDNKFRFDEFDTYYKIENNFILSISEKKKNKPLTKDNLYALKPTGLRFIWDGYVSIENNVNNTYFYDSRIENIELNSFDELRKWIEDFKNLTTEDDLKELDTFKKEKNKRIISKEGDFFAFKLDRRSYGFGRIILNLFEIYKKDKKFFDNKQNLGLSYFNAPVLVKIYLYDNVKLNIDLDYLKSCKSFPSFVITDYHLLKGQYKIIGNKKIEEHEYDFPIDVGLFSTELNYPYNTESFFQWGLIFKTNKSILWYKNSLLSKVKLFTNGTFNIVQSIINLELYTKCKLENNIDFFWDEYNVSMSEISKNEEVFTMNNNLFIDLRSPFYVKEKETLFQLFNIDINKTYYENYVEFLNTKNNNLFQ